jgi:hypothetical protein
MIHLNGYGETVHLDEDLTRPRERVPHKSRLAGLRPRTRTIPRARAWDLMDELHPRELAVAKGLPGTPVFPIGRHHAPLTAAPASCAAGEEASVTKDRRRKGRRSRGN